MSITEAPHRETPATPVVDLRPSRLRFLPAALLPIVAVAAALMWGFAAHVAVGAADDSFVRSDVPGAITLTAHPGTWYLYAEGGTTLHRVQVTGPTGQSVPVVMNTPVSVGYLEGGTSTQQVGRFEVRPGEMGEYRIAVEGTADAYSNGGFAVGEFDVAGFMRPQRWGIAALLLVNVGSSVAIVVMPMIRQRRRGKAGRGAVYGTAATVLAAVVLLAALYLLVFG